MKFVARIIVMMAALISAPAMAGVSAEFTTGAIASYSNENANQNDNARSFSTLGITKVVMSQGGANWGGTQGNDTIVTITILFTDSTSAVFTGVLNWQLNDGGGAIPVSYFGVTTSSVIPDTEDRYDRPTPDLKKTYILVLPSKVVSSDFASRIANDTTDGSANFNEAAVFAALIGEFPPADAAPVITGPIGGPGAAASAISVNENQTAVSQITANEAVTWSITGGTDAAKFQIAADGTITFVAAPDFESPTDNEGNNTYVLTVTATDGAGNTSTQTVTVTVLDLDDSGPVITGPSGGPGAAASAISVNENQTAVSQITANEAVTWSITGGTDAAKFQIAADGTITFVAAPDFESPTDNDGNNTYVLTVTATDGAGNTSTQTVTVTVLDLDDTAPVITGPNGGPGAAASGVSVNENQTSATRVQANETVTWSITGGTDAAKFEIAADGTITFRAAPDFDSPGDSDRNNTYALIITATDGAGNTSTQTVTVTVLDLDDTAPVITGPNGGPGAAASTITINEGLTSVTTFTANERVTWSLNGGADAGSFRIDAATGAVTFISARDFENPIDADRNNTYIVVIRAVDAAGNVSLQTLTVIIGNIDEIGRKLSEIGGKLKFGLRTYATQSLSDMLSFNEGLMRNGNDDTCANPSRNRDASGQINVSDTQATLDVKYTERLSQCGRPYQILTDVGLSSSRMAGNWNTRIFGSLRIEARIDADTVIGAGVMASRADDSLLGFARSEISDQSLQGNVYARYRLSETLRTGVFVGYGRAEYDFGLTESDGFLLKGEMNGKRHLYGWMLSGEIDVAGMVVTTDAIVSRAVEKLGNATLSAQYLGENRSGIDFNVGTVDVTRISVPATAPINIFGVEGFGRWSRLVLSPGLLCEDNNIDSSALNCGYQLGAKLVVSDAGMSRLYADYRLESAGSLRRSLFGLGYSQRFGPKKNLEVALEANRGFSNLLGQDNRAMLSLRVAR